MRKLFRRKVRHVISLDGALTVDSALSVRMLVTGPQIPEDAPVEEQLRLVVQRFNNIEREAAEDRRIHSAAIRTFETNLAGLRSDFEVGQGVLNSKLLDIAVGNIKLEAVGLILVGLGTVLSTVASIIQAASSA